MGLLLSLRRILDILAGLSVLSWAVSGLLRHPWTGPRICLSLLHTAAGFLFFFREKAKVEGNLLVISACVPSFLVGGLAFFLAAPASRWPIHSISLFFTGTVVTISSLLTLGASFAILPAIREIVVKGPYRFVRHPAYCGELMLVFSCFTARPDEKTLLCFLVAILTMMLRIWAEEELLKEDESYRRYCQLTRWRLCPHIW